MGELLTIAQYELPVKIVLFNNHRLGMVQLEMEVAGLPHYGCELKNPNFAALAEAIGLKGLRVEDPAEVRPALEQALEFGGPVLVDVVTDPNVLAMPPKATVQQAKGFALAMTKMAFAGELGDVTDTVMANLAQHLTNAQSTSVITVRLRLDVASLSPHGHGRPT